VGRSLAVAPPRKIYEEDMIPLVRMGKDSTESIMVGPREETFLGGKAPPVRRQDKGEEGFDSQGAKEWNIGRTRRKVRALAIMYTLGVWGLLYL